MDDKDVAAFMDYLWFMDDKPWDFDEFCVFLGILLYKEGFVVLLRN